MRTKLLAELPEDGAEVLVDGTIRLAEETRRVLDAAFPSADLRLRPAIWN
jgi:hypothetical protein